MTDPAGSFTVPVRTPLMFCAKAGASKSDSRIADPRRSALNMT
jgi:hypothetical protein